MYDANFIDLPMEWDDLPEADVPEAATRSIPDALILSLTNLGKVDIEYIAKASGEDVKAVIKALRGSIYQNPDTWGRDELRGWETAEEYLSGNLMRKLRRARGAAKAYGGHFRDNVSAITKLLPESPDADEIYITLGSPWIPTDIIDSFVSHLLVRGRKQLKVDTSHNELTGSWEIPKKRSYSDRYVAARTTYGTSRINAVELIDKALNMKTVAVYDETGGLFSKKKKVLNQAETVMALEKQQKILTEFRKWVWSDENRRARLEQIFEDRYGCVRRRVFDGSFLTFPGMSKDVTLYPYQKNAVARILFSPNTLLAHDVGSGKSYVMIAAGMELRRMGLSRKNLYVVPNNIVSQWKSFFNKLYKDAKVLCVEAKNFTPEKRRATLESIRDGEWDAVIMAYSCFERIPVSKLFLLEELKQAKDELEESEQDSDKKTSVSKRRKEQINKEIEEILEAIDLGDGICFDDLGITRLFVDEAHNYKNVPIDTKIDRVLGISAGGSKKCKDMMNKVHFVQKQNDGGGVVMATGTPITNSITDVFIMQKYLQSGELAMLDLQTFDSWVGMFAEKVTEFEVDVDTNGYRLATRFSKFHNLPELTALLSSIADFHSTEGDSELPEFDGYTDTLVPKTVAFSHYLKDISHRAEMVRNGLVDRRDDNMLKITTDGRKAALDIRLVDDKVRSSYNSKVERCAENVYNIYINTMSERSTQIIFCDTSTPKQGFNVYDDVKGLLISRGIPEGEIAFVHDVTTETSRAKLFERVRRGEIRVLFGSTFKLGMGVNVQDKLIAIHHLDLPWRPADMTQREGRILRQGNTNDRVFIYRYVTEGSFDAYSWQLLETKQRFITELLSGSLTDRSGSDIDGTVLNYAEIKALAIGNPLVKERVETANELKRVSALQRKSIETRLSIEKELLGLPAAIKRQRENVENCRKDLAAYRSSFREFSKEERVALRQAFAEALEAHRAAEGEEKVLFRYQGFDVVLPEFDGDKPYLWLKNNGRYYIELGESDQGALTRVDNYLKKLDETYDKMRSSLSDLISRRNTLQEELERKEDHAEIIETLREKLSKIDKKLGVNVA